MQLKWILCIVLSAIVINGCKKSETNQAASQGSSTEPTSSSRPAASVVKQETSANKEVPPKTDACSLLSSNEIQSVQGEPLKETKLSGRADGGFSVSQCFFTLPTFTNSISLSVTQRGEGTGARDPKEFWENTLAENRESRDKRERGHEKGKSEEEDSAPPQKVTGVGDEAFWMGSRVGGALYVLKGNTYVRLSIGGSGDQASKIRRSRILARKVLPRL